MRPRTKIHLVVCEGEDDRRVMQALANHAGFGDRLVFEDYANAGSLRAYLRALHARPEFTSGAIASVLVTRDADNNFENAWRSVHDAVKAVFSIELPEPGTWLAVADIPRFAAWIVPGPGQTGMIETLCLDAAREFNQTLFDCLDSFMDCLARTQGVRPHEKARFHHWTIAAQGPGAQDRLSLKVALNHMPPDWNAGAFSKLTEILRSAVISVG